MTDLNQALLRGVLESCRRHLPPENVHYIHTIARAVENALAHMASTISLSETQAASYVGEVERAVGLWLTALPPAAGQAGREHLAKAMDAMNRAGGSAIDRIGDFRASILDAISSAHALASDGSTGLQDLLSRLSAYDLRFDDELTKYREAFTTSTYDVEDTEIDPGQAKAVFRRIFDDHDQLQVTMLRPLNGLHSREIHFVDIAEGETWERRLVIRRDRKENLTPGSVADEYEVMRLLYDAGLPVPEPVGVGRTEEELGRPFVAMTRVDALPLDIHTDPAVVDRMLDAAELLARYHAIPIEGTVIGNRITSESIERHYLDVVIPYWEAEWRALGGVHSFTMEWALQFLRRFPKHSEAGFHLIHGDYTARQMLVTPDRFVALLDFELAGAGSPAEDLACIKEEVEPVMDWHRFLQRYIDCGGVNISEETLNYFDIFIQFRNLIIVSKGQDIFQRGQIADIHFGVMGISWLPPLLNQLEQSLKRVTDRQRDGIANS